MSINIRYITNGKKEAYVVFNKAMSPPTTQFFERLKDIDESIRHFAPEGKPKYYGPDMARFVGRMEVGTYDLLDYFYPNHPNCTLPKYAGTKCIAESCRYAPNDEWLECEHLDI